MAGKRSMPSVWANRGALVASATAAALVAWAVAGAVMLFLPRGQVPTATIEPSTTDGADVVVESPDEEPSLEEMAPPNTDWGAVRTVPPVERTPPSPVAHPAQTDGPDAGGDEDSAVGSGGDGADGDSGGGGSGDGVVGDSGEDGGGDGGGGDHPGRGNANGHDNGNGNGNGPPDPPGRR